MGLFGVYRDYRGWCRVYKGFIGGLYGVYRPEV